MWLNKKNFEELLESATQTEEDLKKCEIERDHYKSQSRENLKEIEEIKNNCKITEEVIKTILNLLFYSTKG